MFNKRTLVLERVTLAEMVKFVVKMFIDLAAGPVLDEESAQDTHPTHPHHLTVPH